MFENIICQDAIVESLGRELAAGTLPSSLLLWGPDYAGKMSVALELARVLSCGEKTGEWGCGCKACGEHRLLAHPYTILLGGRYFAEEAAACAGVLRKTRSLPARYLFIRALRKLLRRFDPALWEGKDADLRKILPSAQAAEEAIEAILPGGEFPEEKKAEKLINQALEAVKKICDTVHLESVPIDVLRNASSWTHVGASGAKKVVIIENADKIQEKTHNTLLKILEEPPRNTVFILTATRRAALLPTILSRVRTYRFLPRGGDADRQVLAKIFREDSPSGSLRDYFRMSRGIDSSAARAAARNFLVCAVSRKKPFSGIFEEDSSWLADKTRLRVFLQELADTLERVLRGEETEPAIPLSKLEDAAALVRKSRESLDVLNIAPQLLTQRLYNVIGRK